jgi:hypothetical protein
MRAELLRPEERARLLAEAAYEGSPLHKREPGDFGLTPPASPRPTKALCDEAAIKTRAAATELFMQAIQGGLVSDPAVGLFPKFLWVVDEQGRVFEAIYGGSQPGRYHGYPIRRNDPFFDDVITAWERRHG